MKLCKKCNNFKSLSLFTSHKASKDKLHPWCYNCLNKYKKDRYSNNLEESRKYNNKKRSERVEWIQSFKKDKPCYDCGLIFEPYCMDFDHIPELGIKNNSISRMVLQNSSKNLILKEIKKCQLVCVLCHNKRTNFRFNQKLGEQRKYSSTKLRNIKIIENYKNKSCQICNQKYDLFNMQLDHIDPSNKFKNVCSLKSCKIETLNQELLKCRVLCALCHRKKSILDQRAGKFKKTNN